MAGLDSSPPPLRHSGSEAITITEVFAPNKIWAKPSVTSSDGRFQQLERQMARDCTERMHQLRAELRVRPGQICVYHPAATNHWYRVRVLTRFRRAAGLQCDVRLLDHGERKTVPDVDLFSLPEPYDDLNKLPAQAFRIRLSGLWPTELGYVVSEEGTVLSTIDRSQRWSEAACALTRRLLTAGTPCQLVTSRVDGHGVRHGRILVLGRAEPDLAQRLAAEGLAKIRTEPGDSSSEAEDTELVAEPSLRRQEVLDSDDDSDPVLTPESGRTRSLRPSAEGVADLATFRAEQRRAEEEFRRLQQQQQEQTPTASRERAEQRDRLQRALAGLLMPATTDTNETTIAIPDTTETTTASTTDQMALPGDRERAVAGSSPLGRGRGSLSPRSPGDRGPPPSGSPGPGSPSPGSPSPGSPSPGSPGSLAAALRQLRSESSSADEAARRSSAVLLPAGQTSSARMAAAKKLEAERRQRDYELRLRRRAEREAAFQSTPRRRASPAARLNSQADAESFTSLADFHPVVSAAGAQLAGDSAGAQSFRSPPAAQSVTVPSDSQPIKSSTAAQLCKSLASSQRTESTAAWQPVESPADAQPAGISPKVRPARSGVTVQSPEAGRHGAPPERSPGSGEPFHAQQQRGSSARFGRVPTATWRQRLLSLRSSRTAITTMSSSDDKASATGASQSTTAAAGTSQSTSLAAGTSQSTSLAAGTSQSTSSTTGASQSTTSAAWTSQSAIPAVGGSRNTASEVGTSQRTTSTAGTLQSTTSAAGASQSVKSPSETSRSTTSAAGTSQSTSSEAWTSQSIIAAADVSQSTTSAAGTSQKSTSAAVMSLNTTHAAGESQSITSEAGTSQNTTSASWTSQKTTPAAGASQSTTSAAVTSHSITSTAGTSHSTTLSARSSQSTTYSPGTSLSTTSAAGASQSATSPSRASRNTTSVAGASQSTSLSAWTSQRATLAAGASQSATSSSASPRSATSAAGASQSTSFSAGTSQSTTSVAGASHSTTSAAGTPQNSTSATGTSPSTVPAAGASQSTTSAAGMSQSPTPAAGAAQSTTSAGATSQSTATAEMTESLAAAVDVSGRTDGSVNRDRSSSAAGRPGSVAAKLRRLVRQREQAASAAQSGASKAPPDQEIVAIPAQSAHGDAASRPTGAGEPSRLTSAAELDDRRGSMRPMGDYTDPQVVSPIKGPASQETSPAKQETRTAPQEAGPALHDAGPASQETRPAPQEAGPAPQEAGQAPQETRPAPQGAGPSAAAASEVSSPPAAGDTRQTSGRSAHLKKLLDMRRRWESPQAPPNQAPAPAPTNQAPTLAPTNQAPTPAPVNQAPAPASQVQTPVPASKAPTLVPSNQAPTPAPVSQAPTPAPAPANQAPTPAPVNQALAPVPANQAQTPIPANQEQNPAPANQAPTPASANQAQTLAPTNQAQSPARANQAPTSARTSQVPTSVPAPANQTQSPVPANQAPTPIPTNLVPISPPPTVADAAPALPGRAAASGEPAGRGHARSVEARAADACSGPVAGRRQTELSEEEPPAAEPRPSLQQLMSGAGLRERAPPPPPGTSHFDSAMLRVLVNGRRKVAPYWRTEQMPFVDMILQKLSPVSFRPSRVQAYLWAAAARYRTTVCVSPAHSGKTLGYLLAVVNSILDTETYADLPAGHGPLALVLVPSWRRARAVQELCLAVTDSLRCLPLLVHGGGAEKEQEVALMNGCDLLVGTPACLLRLLQRGRDTFLQLMRVCHLVLDDADLLVEHCTRQVEQLLVAVFSCWRARSEEAATLPQQVIVAAAHWTQGLRALTRELADPVVATSCYIEQLVWARPKVFTHVLEDTQKDQKLIGLLESGLHRHRLVVFTSSDQSAQRLARLLRSQSYPVLLADGDQLGASLTELERCWWSSGGVSPDILVVSDTVVAELAVRDAAALIHYDVPTEKRTQLGLRCSYLMDSYPDRITRPEAENPCVVHLLVSPSAAAQIGLRLQQLLGRLGAAVPPALAEAAALQRRSGGRQLCPELLATGRCRDRLGCELRHWLHPAADAAHRDLPHHGEVTVSVCHVQDAATLSVRLLSVREPDGGGARCLEEDCCRIELDVCAHYSQPDNRVCHELAQVGDVCGLEWDGMFVRAQVTSLETGPTSCATLLIDFGNTETVPRSRLLSLPEPLAAAPPQAITVHLCGVEPVDGDAEWTDQATRLTADHLGGQTAVGKIVLAVGRRLWLSPLVRRRQHQLYQTSATLLDPSLACQLLERGFGQPAPHHLDTLYRLCEQAGLPLQPHWRPADRRKLYRTEYLPLVAPLKTNSSVNITNVISPDEFYVQRNDVFPQYERLMSELNRWAEGPEAARLTVYRHRVRQHCVAQFPEDGRWYRAQVVSVTADDSGGQLTYEVLYTDVGDSASVEESRVLPLPERFARRLPLQAIRCQLAFCLPAAADGVWSEDACDALHGLSLDEQQLWIPYHCQVVGRAGGRYRVLLFDPERRGVAQQLADSGLARLDQLELMNAEPPQFPSSSAAGPLDSEDSDSGSDSQLRLAEKQAGVTYQDVLQAAPKEDGVPVMEFGDFEIVGFPFSKLSREQVARPASSAESIEVISPECAGLAAAAESPPPPVHITELGSGDPPADLDDWEQVPPPPPPQVVPPPPLAFPAERAGPCARTPRVSWWQDSTHVRLYIHLSDVRLPRVDIQPTHFHFSCTQADCQYVVAISLFSAVRPQDSSYQVFGARVHVKLRKDKSLSWRRLTAAPVKAPWLSHDLDHLGSDSSSDETFRRVAVARPPPGPPLEALKALQRGRPAQPEPADALPAATSSSESDDDMEQDLGDSRADLETLNDPQAVRELLSADPWAAAEL